MQLMNETNAQIVLRANYYNGRLDCWEPCLENLQIEMRGRSQANGSSDMVIDVKDSISLNVSEELIENLICLQNLSHDTPLFINQKYQAPTVFSLTPTTQFKITNLTSKAVMIYPNSKNTNKLREKILKHHNLQ